MKLKFLISLILCSLTAQVSANLPNEKFSYCSNGNCRMITTDDYYYARGMPRDLNFSCKNNNQYALTFDDGPSANYPRLLEILARHNVKATFFVVGGNVMSKEGDKLFGQMVSAGHFMANHTLNHADLTALNADEIYEQIEKSRTALLNVTSLKYAPQEFVEKLQKSTKYLRPPFGNIDAKVDQVFKKNGYVAVRWNGDRYDWNMPGNDVESTQTIIKRVVQQLDFIKMQKAQGTDFNTSILDLNHDFQNTTLDALDVYIPLIKARGYEFVTMDECLY